LVVLVDSEDIDAPELLVDEPPLDAGAIEVRAPDPVVCQRRFRPVDVGLGARGEGEGQDQQERRE